MSSAMMVTRRRGRRRRAGTRPVRVVAVHMVTMRAGMVFMARCRFGMCLVVVPDGMRCSVRSFVLVRCRLCNCRQHDQCE